MPVTASLFWAPRTFKTMDRWAPTITFLRKGLIITLTWGAFPLRMALLALHIKPLEMYQAYL